MIDIHSHILPGIDDGVKTEDDAVEFARLALSDGIETIVATPHCKEGFFFNDRSKVLQEVEKLRARLATEGVGIRVEPGAEVHICPDLVQRIADGRAPTLMDNRRTLLLELSLSQYPVELENLVFELKLAGLEVVFAHPERIRYFQDDLSRYEAVIRQGATGQITSGSILGVFGTDVGDFSEELLTKGLVHVIASDAHNTRGRPPLLGEAVEVSADWIGEARARAMVNEAPRSLLDGQTPELPPVEAPRSRVGGFLSRFFRSD
ncbi:MAG: capsular biosynthesis protein [Acidobacteria bacterium]|nr:capsular biosynthesis protein [Acidobacteriota bacterium]NIM62065.1 capsular biosynthesis protein [Acidobacteriota bacterium]NIO59714.1 capsular biosynthesis protein [Acidobacteriota bacterium]NIQ30803.1 capsular biosynthesis protein [Acidobacteriota bacterium]NIQ85865.1 capsular biosynthesis protein [Acidobacteriota bacterium]